MFETTDRLARDKLCPYALTAVHVADRHCKAAHCMAWKTTRNNGDKESWGYCERINQKVSIE
jgi:hypothetical protein